MGLALLLPPLQAKSAGAAPQSAPSLDLWAWATGWLQPHGRLGFAVLVGLVVVGWVLDKTQGLEALLRLLGLNRTPPEPPPVHQNETHGTNSPVITGGTFTPEGSQFIGGEHTHLPSPSPLAGSSTTVDVSCAGNTTLTNVVAARDVIVSPTIHHHPQPEAPPKGTPCNLRFRSIGSLFKGRAPLIEKLEAATCPVALIGLGGVGKTRLAIEHAWRQLSCRQAVLLVSADSPEALNRNLAGLCAPQTLDLPQKEEREEALQRGAVLQWLQAHPGWLLILDSVDTPGAASAVEVLLPQLAAGQVVITTRLSNWSAAVQGVEVAVLEPEDARDFLLERTAARRRKADDDTTTAETIAVDDLGRLALALEQAGAFISERRLSLKAYRKEWEGNREAVLRWLDPRLMQYDRSLATTWFTSYKQLDPPAQTLFRRLAWLSPEPIPECLLDVVVLGDPEASRTAKDALSQLDEYSLVNRYLENSTFNVHRLTQVASRTMQAQLDDSYSNELQNALYWIALAFDTDYQIISKSSSLGLIEPHVASICRFAMVEGLAVPTGALISRLGIFYFEKALYDLAEMCFRNALHIAESLFEASSPQIATALINLSTLLLARNRVHEAEPIVNRALAIDEAYYGSPHPVVARDLDSLAQLHYQRGELSTAEDLFRRALLSAQSSNETSELDLALYRSNLAQSLKSAGNLNEALPLARRALSIAESRYGFDHPKISIYLNNLSMLLCSAGEISDAQELISRAIEIDEANHQSAHPNLSRSLHSLALLMLKMNQLDKAEALFRTSLAIDEEIHGPKHPTVATLLHNLGLTLLFSGRILEAEQFLHRAIKIEEESLGADHPELATSLNHLALLMQVTNRLSEAEPLSRRNIEILKVCSRKGFHSSRLEAGISAYRELLHAMGLTEPDIQAKLQALLLPT